MEPPAFASQLGPTDQSNTVCLFVTALAWSDDCPAKIAETVVSTGEKFDAFRLRL